MAGAKRQRGRLPFVVTDVTTVCFVVVYVCIELLKCVKIYDLLFLVRF